MFRRKKGEGPSEPAEAAPAGTPTEGEPPPPQPTRGAPPVPADLLAELDAARDRANRDDDDASRAHLYELMLRLPAWTFITDADSARRAVETGGAPRFLVLRNERARFVPVFSTTERAHAAARSWGADSKDDGTVSLLTFDVRASVGFVCSVEASVEYAMLDLVPDEIDGYGVSIDALPSQYERHVGTPPAACLNRMADLANRHGHPGAYISAYRVIAAHEAVFLTRTKAGAPALMPHEDKLVCPMFTDERHAAAFAETQPNLEMFACPPADLPRLGDQLAGVAGDKFIGMIANPTANAPLFVRLDWFGRALEGGRAASS